MNKQIFFLILLLGYSCLWVAQAQTGAPYKPAATEKQNESDSTASEESDLTPIDPPQQAEETAEAASVDESKEQAAGNTKPKQKVFRPSEEISEDRPVPFPVDI